MFWRVGSSATLGTTTSFAGDILAQTSVTLNTGANIICGAAWAHTGAVTLDTNTIRLCDLLGGGSGGGGGILGPIGPPLIASLLPPSASTNQRSVANAIDTFVGNGGTLPLGFLNLFNLSSSDLGNALTQLSGESGTGPAQAGTQAMNSFLSLVTNPFAENRPFAQPRPVSPAMPVKAISVTPALNPPDARRWGVWAAAYGGQTNAGGDALGVGSHDRSVSDVGFATGLDYRVTPYTVAGFALSGGATRYGLSEGLGGGRSDMFQAAIYSTTRVDAAYVSAAIAYGFHQFNTDRFVTVPGADHLAADFSANDIGGRLEGGYRFAIPSMGWSGQYGLHSLRRCAGAGLPNAVLQRNCALRRVGFRTFLRRQDDHHDPHGAWHLARLEHSGRLRHHTVPAWPCRLGSRQLVLAEYHSRVPGAARINLRRDGRSAGHRFGTCVGWGGDRV